MNTKVLCDENYENEYNKVITDFCRENEKSNFFSSFDGNKMHYLSYINENAEADVVIIHGFTECARKFDEMAYYFFCEGYSVFSLDLRGHGLSFKDDAPEYAVDSRGFDFYSRDIGFFIKNIVAENNLPVYLYTHSLGGNAALLSLIDDELLPVKKLVLSSPMICGNMGMPVFVAKIVSSLVCALGKGKMPAPGKCVYEPEKSNPDAKSKNRGEHDLKVKKENREYQTCGPTMSWVRHSIKAMEKILREENISKLKTEILLIKPQEDRQLLESYQDRFILLCRKRSKKIKVIMTKNTCHEIFRSEEKELTMYLEDIFEFLG